MALVLPEDLDLVQPGATPFGDINLKITRTTPIRRNAADEEEEEVTSAAPFYTLQPLADMQKSSLLQEALADTYADAGSISAVISAIDKFIVGVKDRGSKLGMTKSGKTAGASWLKSAQISRDWLAAGADKYKCPSPIFVKGNNKLPYWAFSTLPGATCPGAGLCLRRREGGVMKRGFCYSFKGWRYPATFFRQLNLTMLMRLPEKWQILEAMDKITKGKNDVVLRLYVDGDMDSVRTIRFWMETLKKYPMVKAYGYSKSWDLFLDYDKKYNGDWPKNYVLNLSGGSRFDNRKDMVAAMQRLPITRGTFVAVDIPKIDGKKIPQNVIDTDKLTPKQRAIFESTQKIPANISEMAFRRNKAYTDAVQREARAQLGISRFFVCPGKCGNCLGSGKHACGQGNVKIPIIIGKH
jgi:hypothetical protein